MKCFGIITIIDGYQQRCADSDFFESGSNPALSIFNPNPLRIRHQHETSNPTPV